LGGESGASFYSQFPPHNSSADKNVKIWGLDFGDCHKSFFAHQEVVTAVKFEGNTHHVWSTGRDHAVKQWDADTFVQIQVGVGGRFDCLINLWGVFTDTGGPSGRRDLLRHRTKGGLDCDW
jgi:WD40 repeat protein